MTGRDTLRNNRRLGIPSDMNHLRSRVGLLIIVGNSDGIEFRRTVIATKNARGVFPRDGGARLHLRPREFAALTTQVATLGHQIQHTALAVFIARIPVLNGRILHFRTIHHDNLDDGRVQLVFIAHGGGAAFEIADIRIVVGNNQRTLKLPRIAGIDAEIRAELHRATNTLGDIDKRAVREHGAIERCKVIVAIGYNGTEILTHHVGMLLDGLADGAEDDTLFTKFFLKGGLH